jgi:hypothetical protein
MKLILSIITLALFSYTLKAQNSVDFGIMGGMNLTFFKVVEGGFGTYNEVEVSYYGGVFADFTIDKQVHFQPELLYIGLGDFKFLNAPLYLKYNINSNFDILIGPSLNYFFDFFSNKFKVRADLSIAYNISSALNLHMKYTLGFAEFSPNGLYLGTGYKL